MATKPDLHPGLPSEVISAVASIMDKLHELSAKYGVYSPVALMFTAYDDSELSHYLHFIFDKNRGDGEYVLVRYE